MKCCDITAGQLNIKTQIYSPAETSNGQGGFTKSWVLLVSPWARVKPKSGSEKLHSQRLNAHGLASMIIRHREDLNESMKVVVRGRDHQVRSIVNIEEADEWIELIIERGVPQ